MSIGGRAVKKLFCMIHSDTMLINREMLHMICWYLSSAMVYFLSRVSRTIIFDFTNFQHDVSHLHSRLFPPIHTITSLTLQFQIYYIDTHCTLKGRHKIHSLLKRDLIYNYLFAQNLMIAC